MHVQRRPGDRPPPEGRVELGNGRNPAPALYELATGTHFAYALDERNLGGDFGAVLFASVFFGNFNNYCAFICLALPMMFGTLEASRLTGRRWFWATCISLTYLILTVNANRLSMVFAAVLLVYYLVTRRNWRLPFGRGLSGCVRTVTRIVRS